jgi:hypothetical protein
MSSADAAVRPDELWVISWNNERSNYITQRQSWLTWHWHAEASFSSSTRVTKKLVTFSLICKKKCEQKTIERKKTTTKVKIVSRLFFSTQQKIWTHFNKNPKKIHIINHVLFYLACSNDLYRQSQCLSQFDLTWLNLTFWKKKLKGAFRFRYFFKQTAFNLLFSEGSYKKRGKKLLEQYQQKEVICVSVVYLHTILRKYYFFIFWVFLYLTKWRMVSIFR